MKICTKLKHFTHEFISICNSINAFLIVPTFKYKSLNLFIYLLILISDDIRLNLGPTYQDRQMKLNFFKTKDLHFIYPKISSLQPKIEKLQPITKSTKASVTG